MQLRLRSSAERVLRRLAMVAPRAAATVDWLDASKHSSWGGPMNGQSGRQQIVRNLLSSQPVDHIVETGTHRGMTTLFLSHVSGARVLSVESDPRFYHFASKRLSGAATVTLTLGDSRTFLEHLSTDVSITSRPTFFYLDAHWGADCPLADEIRLISERWSDPIVLIDDFAVPDDAGYGFDVCEDGRSFDLGYLPEEHLEDVAVLFPTLPSVNETGAKRGCALLARRDRAARIAAEVPGLRLYEGWSGQSV